MNNPFYYTPSAQCEQAVPVILTMIQSHPEWHEEVRKGKTFGVLATDKETLLAYSGQMLGRYDIEGFVPPVFDYLDENGHFRTHEAQIVEINKEIDHISASEQLRDAREALYEAEKAKPVLPPSRDINPDSVEYAEYCRQRQFEKGEYRRRKAAWNERVGECRKNVQEIQDRITSMKQERKLRSDSLQHWLFENFVMLNARGEKKNLLDIFSEWASRTGSKCVIPPSGSGECCAPKLLQYAYLKGLKPVAIAEFGVEWQEAKGEGLKAKGEGQEAKVVYKQACQSRCKPILDWMLQGLEVEANPLEEPEERTLPVIFENDDIIVVDKPEGMLSVPGKSKRKSALDILREMRPDCPELIMAHRLDMQTSGVLIAARTMEVYRSLQRLFVVEKLSDGTYSKTLRKTYYAVLEGVLPMPVGSKGEISLPLSPDYLNRPCQKIDCENGKEALTLYEVIATIEIEGQPRSLLRLTPVTGRTHQLRVHCAARQGLGMPILGDDLYGHHAARLYLHAFSIGGLYDCEIMSHQPEWLML